VERQLRVSIADVRLFRMLSALRKRVLSLPRYWKRAILVGFDFFALAFVLWASFSLRYDRWEFPNSIAEWAITLSAPVIAIPIFVRMGLYRAVVRYLPERAVWTIVKAMALAAILWVLLAFLSAMAGRGFVPICSGHLFGAWYTGNHR
jgi:FlaA1/EpsC-like NDP-sugar epimerase